MADEVLNLYCPYKWKDMHSKQSWALPGSLGITNFSQQKKSWILKSQDVASQNLSLVLKLVCGPFDMPATLLEVGGCLLGPWPT